MNSLCPTPMIVKTCSAGLSSSLDPGHAAAGMRIPKSLKQSFVAGNVWVMASQMLLAVRGVWLIPVLVASMGIMGYGTYTLVFAAITTLHSIAAAGTGVTYKRFMPSQTDRAKQRRLFYEQFWLHISIVAFIAFSLASFPMMAAAAGKSFAYSAIPVVLLLLTTACTYQVAGFLRLTRHLPSFAVCQTLPQYLDILFLWLMASHQGTLSVDDVLMVCAATRSVVLAPYVVFLFLSIGIRRPTFSTSARMDFILGVPLAGSIAVDFVLSISDKFVIGSLMSAHAVGLYAPAYALGSLVKFIPAAVVYVASTFLARLVDDGQVSVAQRLVDAVVKHFLIVGVGLLAISIPMGHTLLRIVANVEVADAASPVIPLIAGGSLFMGLNQIAAETLFLELKTRDIVTANGIGAACNLLLNLIGIAVFQNILIACMTTLLGYASAFVYLRAASRSNRVRLRLDARLLARLAFAAAAVVGCGYCLGGDAHGWLQPLLLLSSLCAVYGTSLLILRVVTLAEFRNLFCTGESRVRC